MQIEVQEVFLKYESRTYSAYVKRKFNNGIISKILSKSDNIEAIKTNIRSLNTCKIQCMINNHSKIFLNY